MTRDDITDFEFQIESRLTSHGVYVDEVRETEEGYRVVYESMAAEDGVIMHREVGRVINVFRDLHPEDWDGADIEATVLDLDGNEQGYWHVQQEWFAALGEQLTETEFSQRVVDTIESAA